MRHTELYRKQGTEIWMAHTAEAVELRVEGVELFEALWSEVVG